MKLLRQAAESSDRQSKFLYVLCCDWIRNGLRY